MTNYSKEQIKQVVLKVLSSMENTEVPVGISNRHIHLSEEHFNLLFPNEEIEPLKMLKQPGEYAAKQTLTIIGEKNKQEKVRILGPLRKQTQVEISKTDARVLGIDAPIRLSGNLDGAANVTLKSNSNEISVPAAIIAKRHIHMNDDNLAFFDVVPNQVVSVVINTPDRKTVYNDVVIRAGKNFILEMHIDTDEANAANVDANTTVTILKD